MPPDGVSSVAGVKRRREISSEFSSSTVSTMESPPEASLITIEEFLYQKDRYRVAPRYQITTPWPFRQGPATEVGDAVYATEEVSDAVRKALNTFSIKPASIVMRSIWPKGGEREAQDCLIVDTKDENTTEWVQAANEIHRILLKTELKSQAFKVEIRNTGRMYADLSSCIPIDNKDLLGCIRDVEQDLLKLIREKMSNMWTSLAFHMRSGKFKNEEEKPTALVYVKPGARLRFDAIEQQLSESLKSAKYPNVVLNIEILPGEIILANPPRDPSLPRPAQYLLLQSTTPYNGVSIGITGPEESPIESGSLGGWLKLKHKRTGKEYLGWMTCYHCIANGDPENIDDNDFSGIGLGDLPTALLPDISLVWPSRYDAACSMTILQQMVQEKTASPRKLRCLEILQQLKARGPFGKVRFASGHHVRTAQGSRLDWAFIESPASFQQNKPPPAKIPDQELNGIDYEPDASTRIKIWRKPMLGDWVVRTGRTSLRAGFINAIHRTVNWDQHPESKEMEVCGLRDDFGDAGDSGSWVVDRKFNLVGMMIGVDSRGSENVGIITPIQELIRDIENRTGCTVTLP